MKNIITPLLVLTMTINAWAQKVEYIMPASIKTEHASFSFKKVQGNTSSYFINYEAKNTDDGFLIINRKEAVLKQNGGELHPVSGNYILKPGESKTIFHQFRVKAPIKAKAGLLHFAMNGIQYASKSGNTLKAEKLVLASKATQKIGDFNIKIMEYKVYSDRVYANVKCTYNGSQKTIGSIDLNKITVIGGKAKIAKKGDILFPGKSYSFSINITPEAKEYSIDWTSVLNVLKVEELKIEDIEIKSTTYKAEAKEEKTEKKKEAKKKEAEADKSKNCELSYSEFSALKKDIETEIDGGGKPVEMANEFFMAKKCVSTAQIVEFMGIFNLDSQRLAFAKMAYQYASDKHRFHLAVGKLSYTKNKQALEEFLEQQ